MVEACFVLPVRWLRSGFAGVFWAGFVIMALSSMTKSQAPSAMRRLRFAVVVLVSQLLLIGLALAWAVHMVIIAVHGRVYFVEDNLAILWVEIVVTAAIIIFGIGVFGMQLRRLGERRAGDRGSQRR
jgi:hypothetical protein